MNCNTRLVCGRSGFRGERETGGSMEARTLDEDQPLLITTSGTRMTAVTRIKPLSSDHILPGGEEFNSSFANDALARTQSFLLSSLHPFTVEGCS